MRYLNCGDWVETMSAVLEYGDGRMETVLYKDFMKRLAYGKCGTMEDAETSPGTGIHDGTAFIRFPRKWDKMTLCDILSLFWCDIMSRFPLSGK